MIRQTYTFNVRTYECDVEGSATLPSVCNYLQEAASLHAAELGFSKTDFNQSGENISWVLTRLIVAMDTYPRWGETVRVATFPRGGRRIAAWRDFEITAPDGARLGVATSEWMLIDLSARKTVAVPPSIQSCRDASLVPVMGESPFAKLRFPDSAPEPAFSCRAQKSHIDLNGHVNNVRYIEWMLEPSPVPRPGRMEVVFRGEAFAGDDVNVSLCEDGDGRLHRVFSREGKDYIIARTVS